MANSKSIGRNNLGMETLEAFTPSRRTRTLSAGQVIIEVVPAPLCKRQGRHPMAWLFVITYNGEQYAFSFGDKDEGMIYGCTLLRAKAKRALLRNELESKYSTFMGKSERRHWFEKGFYTFFPQRDRCFDDWQHTFVNDKQRLSQAKSKLTKEVKKQLKDQFAPKEVLEACGLQKKKVKGNTTAYFIQLAPEQIVLPDAWEELVEQMPIRA